MNRFFNFLIFSNLYISLAATSLYLYYALLLEKNFFLSSVGLVFCGTYLSYHIVRFVPFKKKKPVESAFQDWYLNHNIFFPVSVLGCGIICFWSLQDLSHFQIVALFISLMIVIFYENILLQSFKLRALSLVKPFVIALSWSFVCVGLHINEKIHWAEFWAFMDCFLFISFLCIPFDIKDKELDSSQGIQTLAHHIENEYLKKILIVLYAVYTLSLTLLLHRPIYLVEFFLFIIGMKYIQRKNLFYLFIDGIIIFRFLALMGRNFF